MRVLIYRQPVHRLFSSHTTISQFLPATQTSSPYHSTVPTYLGVTPRQHSHLALEEVLPDLPVAPRYPCPFLTATDIQQYLLPLYRIGWGISRVANTAGGKIVPPATQLSKRIILPTPEIAEILKNDVMNTIVEQENHHPSWERQEAPCGIDIHVHTHSALAPPDRQHDNHHRNTRKRPGITHRDIRFAILLERLLRDDSYGRFLDYQTSAIFSQPTDIDSVHNFRGPFDEGQDPTGSSEMND